MGQVEPELNAVRVYQVGSGGSGTGDATAAKQDAQTALLTTIDADTGNIATATAALAAKIPGTVMFASVSTASSGDTSIVAAQGSGNKIRVLAYVLVASAAVSVKWRSASTDKTGAMALAANGGVSSGYSPVGHFETAANEALNLNLSGAQQVSGHIAYYVTT